MVSGRLLSTGEGVGIRRGRAAGWGWGIEKEKQSGGESDESYAHKQLRGNVEWSLILATGFCFPCRVFV